MSDPQRPIRDGAVPDPFPPAPPGVEARYEAMIRAHFARRRAVRAWLATGAVAVSASGVLGVLMPSGISTGVLAATVLYTLAYVRILRALKGWVERRSVPS